MARFIADLSSNMLDYTPFLGTFSEQSASRMVLTVPGAPDRTIIFTGSFGYEDPDIGQIPDGFDFGDFDPGDFGGFDPGDFGLPDGFQDFLDGFDGLVPDIGDFEAYDVWGTLTGIEQIVGGETVWKATELNLPLGDDAGEQAVIDALGLFLSGFSGADEVIGSDFEDLLQGYAGNDAMIGGAGDDTLGGGDGYDTAVYSGDRSAYTVKLSVSGIEVQDRRAGGDGADQLSDIEALTFNGVEWPMEIFSNVASLSEDAFREFVEVYIAYFNRAPDAEGLFFYGTAFANGTSLEASAATFLNSEEYAATYPPGSSNLEFATAVYNNVLGRVPDQLGLDFWVGVLESGAKTRDVFILEVLKGAKAPPPADATQHFIDQKAADVAYLSNKADLGIYFAVTKGMSDVANAKTAMQLFDDGEQADIDAAVAAIDGFYADALDPENGEFLLPLVGVVDDPFALA